MSFKDAPIRLYSDHDGSTTVPTDTVFAYRPTPDGNKITALIWWSLNKGVLHSFAYALASHGIPDALPQPGEPNIAAKIERLLDQGLLLPFDEEFARLDNFFQIEDRRPNTGHTFAVWCHTGKVDPRPIHVNGKVELLPNLVPGKVYRCYVDGCTSFDHEPNFPESMDLETLGGLLAGEAATVVRCPNDVPERQGVTLCDMVALHQFASA